VINMAKPASTQTTLFGKALAETESKLQEFAPALQWSDDVDVTERLDVEFLDEPEMIQVADKFNDGAPIDAFVFHVRELATGETYSQIARATVNRNGQPTNAMFRAILTWAKRCNGHIAGSRGRIIASPYFNKAKDKNLRGFRIVPIPETVTENSE